MTQLTIIILSYNTKQLTINCIESIILQYKKQLDDGTFEIIVVDNASRDNTVVAISNLKSKISNLKIIENKKNYGFAKGNNIGAKKAKGKYLFFLNSDTEVKDDGLLGMVDFLDKHENAGICGAKLINTDKTAQASAGNFYNILSLFLVLIGGERLGFVRLAPKNIRRVDWVSGGAMMIRSDLFKKLSGFDEKFFMYMEDMELCYRVKLLGADTYFYPNIAIVHKELGSSNRTFAILNIYKGFLYFYKKHKGIVGYYTIKLLLVAKALIAIFVGILTNNNYLKLTYRKALAIAI